MQKFLKEGDESSVGDVSATFTSPKVSEGIAPTFSPEFALKVGDKGPDFFLKKSHPEVFSEKSWELADLPMNLIRGDFSGKSGG